MSDPVCGDVGEQFLFGPRRRRRRRRRRKEEGRGRSSSVNINEFTSSRSVAGDSDAAGRRCWRLLK